jgi:predicted RNase H-like HicB family nuclease
VKVHELLELLAGDGWEIVDLILIEGGPPSNYSAWSPDPPGCAAAWDSLEGVEREMRAAIALDLEGLADDGAEIPEALPAPAPNPK